MSAAGEPRRALVRDILQTAFRMLPWPTEPGLRHVGEPGPDSPVVVTCNYDLTVRRVMRALAGVDAWVVVAPSGGVNVWCASSGGLLTSHQVITALKTSGVEDRVTHRRAILPQLAATGVIAQEVSRRSGWHVKFGPAYARDLPRYLAANNHKTPDMRTVRFGVGERLEMAAAWAAPTALVVGAACAFVRPAWALSLIALTAALGVTVFLGYDRLPSPRRVWLGGAAIALSLGAVALAHGGATAFVAAAVAPIALTGLLTFDYSGSTPVEGGSHFEERAFTITLEAGRCAGVFNCIAVCPENVYVERTDARKVRIARADACIKCAACVVQCPKDALYLESGDGRRIEPDTIRRFKLNLVGRRAVDRGERVGAD